ncbi:MAG: hypothetical protein AABZ57_03260 [Candidatus Margulisiibacteriota bacterium]
MTAKEKNVNGRITGIGSNAVNAYNKSRKVLPQYEPLLEVVPSRHCLFL